MSTIIYSSPIFGPVMSRRLGVSLGVNLMPGDGKVCTFDCIYCECGFNKEHIPHSRRPTREEVAKALEEVLRQRKANDEPLDDIAFAGNGEPTAHPDFSGVIEDTMRLRNEYFPKATVSVLSNATFVWKEEVRKALMLVDNNIQKLDTINPAYIKMVDRPQQSAYDVRKVISDLKKFNGKVILQTMFIKGIAGGQNVDNTSEEYVRPWLEAVREIMPQKVMIYTIDRETPAQGLQKADPTTLNAIKQRVTAMGIECTASY